MPDLGLNIIVIWGVEFKDYNDETVFNALMKRNHPELKSVVLKGYTNPGIISQIGDDIDVRLAFYKDTLCAIKVELSKFIENRDQIRQKYISEYGCGTGHSDTLDVTNRYKINEERNWKNDRVSLKYSRFVLRGYYDIT